MRNFSQKNSNFFPKIGNINFKLSYINALVKVLYFAKIYEFFRKNVHRIRKIEKMVMKTYTIEKYKNSGKHADIDLTGK